MDELSLIVVILAHVQGLLGAESREMALQQHSLIQQTIFDRPNATQTHKSRTDGRISTFLTPVYLCLQCPYVFTPDNRDKHFETKKHAFCMNSDTHNRSYTHADTVASHRVEKWLPLLQTMSRFCL
jgi:hypothetical protein